MGSEDNGKTSFITKVVIVSVSVAVVFSFLLPDTDKLKKFDTPINKIYALSFIQNPEALYMSSEYWEREGKFDNAIRDLRLAIGLLEMHHAEATIIKRYQDKLESLRKNH